MTRNRKRTTSKAKWSREDLQKAILAAKNGTSMRKAAKENGIPFSTLQERMASNNLQEAELGRKPVFSREQEDEMAEHVKYLASIFYGVTAKELRRLAFEFAERNNIQHTFNVNIGLAGIEWLRSFLRRNPTVSVRKAEGTSLNRLTAFNKEEVDLFFKLMENLMTKHQFPPSQIYNADETGVSTVQDPGKILATKGQKRVGFATSGERGRNITVMCAINAAGGYIPPMFIFPRKRLTPLLEKDGPAEALYKCTNNGWIDENIFYEWLHHFKKFSNPSENAPVLLILDNHSSHISLKAYDFCKANHIIMLSIPPHSSHKIQPLDVVFYGPLKNEYRNECNLFMKTQLMRPITPYDVAALFNRAYSTVATISKGVSGFRSAGIYPLNPKVFTEQDFLPATILQNDAFVVQDNEADSSLTKTNSDSEAGPSNIHKILPPKPCIEKPQLTTIDDNQQAGPSTTSTNSVSFAQLTTIPKSALKTRKNRRKQHAKIITSTPMKQELEEKQNKKQEKEEKKLKASSKKEKKLKQTKNLPLKNKISYKRKVFESSSSDSDIDIQCDDNDDDEVDEDRCLVCNDFGKQNEMWFRCTLCSRWAHSECSGWDTPAGYICDDCQPFSD